MAAGSDRCILFALTSSVHRPVEKTGQIHSDRSEEHTSELQSQSNLVCRLLLEKKKKKKSTMTVDGRLCRGHKPGLLVGFSPYRGTWRPSVIDKDTTARRANNSAPSTTAQASRRPSTSSYVSPHYSVVSPRVHRDSTRNFI